MHQQASATHNAGALLYNGGIDSSELAVIPTRQTTKALLTYPGISPGKPTTAVLDSFPLNMEFLQPLKG